MPYRAPGKRVCSGNIRRRIIIYNTENVSWGSKIMPRFMTDKEREI